VRRDVDHRTKTLQQKCVRTLTINVLFRTVTLAEETKSNAEPGPQQYVSFLSTAINEPEGKDRAAL